MEAIRLVVRAESRALREDTDGARQDLEAAVSRAPTYAAAHEQLVALYEAAGEHAKAADIYRRLLDIQPRHLLALNNLAWHLAAREGKLEEALPLAQRARTLDGNNPAVADTLGWIYYLLGDARQALPLLVSATRGAPQHAGIRWRLAAVQAAIGQVDQARRTLDEALALDASLAEEGPVRELREKLAAGTTP